MRNRPPSTLTLRQFTAELRSAQSPGVPPVTGRPVPSAALQAAAAEDRSGARIYKIYREGAFAGLLGAATIALWFFFLDLLEGRPLYTPSVLADVLFRKTDPAIRAALSYQMILLFTCVHGLVFAVIGGISAQLLAVAEHVPRSGFGVLLLFVALDVAFVVPSMFVAQEALQALAWPAVLVGNLLAAGVLAGYLWRRHPKLRTES